MKGFTYIELILYISIVSIMLATLIPFAWNMVEGGTQSAVQQEVSSNTRFISERIKYEIRNATGINTGAGNTDCSITDAKISLVNNTASLNPTVITYDSINSDVIIKQGTTGPLATPMPLNSNDVLIKNFSCTNNTSVDNKTKNIFFKFDVQQSYTGTRADFKSSMTVQSSAELRSN